MQNWWKPNLTLTAPAQDMVACYNSPQDRTSCQWRKFIRSSSRNPQNTKEHTIAAVALAPKREAAPIDKTLWEEHMAGIEKGIERLMLYHQMATEMNTNTLAGPDGNYRSVGNTAMRGRSYQPMPGCTTGNVEAGANQPERCQTCAGDV